MQIRPLGSQGVKASLLGLGCMGMSEFYGKPDEPESLRAIWRAIARGITFFDTADIYGPYHNEELLGKAIKEKRQGLTIATKFGILRDPKDPAKREVSGKPDYMKISVEGSLKRLGIETIDLYYLHRVDPQTPIEETVGAMADLVRQGKIRAIGLSEAAPSTLRRAHSVFPVSALQTEYSLWSREPEDEIFGVCQELGIAFVAYSPLGRGFLTGQIKTFEDLEPGDYRRFSPRFQGENFTRNLELVKKLGEMAAIRECTAGQLALAWVLAQGDFIFPIPGTKHVHYLDQNIEATGLRLSPTELKTLDEIAPKNIAAGTRYPPQAMSSVNR